MPKQNNLTAITCVSINKPVEFSLQCLHIDTLPIFSLFIKSPLKQRFYDNKRHLGVSGWDHPHRLPHKTQRNHVTHHMMSHVATGLLSMTLCLSLTHLQPFLLHSLSFYFKLKLSSSLRCTTVQLRGTCMCRDSHSVCCAFAKELTVRVYQSTSHPIVSSNEFQRVQTNVSAGSLTMFMMVSQHNYTGSLQNITKCVQLKR